MKRLLCLLLLCCLPLLAQAAPERFVDEAIGAELMVPEEWTTSGGEGQYMFTSPDESICVTLMTLSMTAEEFTAEIADQMLGEVQGSLSVLPGYRQIGLQISEDPEDPGFTLTAAYTLGEDEEIIRLVMIGLGNGEEMLNITCTYPEADIDAAEDILQAMLLPLSEDEMK